MPEFIADTDGTIDLGGHILAYDDLSPFVQGYIECILFTETASGISMVEWNDPENVEDVEEGRADGSIPEDSGFGDIHPQSFARIIADCEAFQAEAADLLEQAYERDYDATQAGRDFWFTRCGHGVGFWDRRELESDGLGDNLSAIARRYGDKYASFGTAANGEESPTGYGFVFVE